MRSILAVLLLLGLPVIADEPLSKQSVMALLENGFSEAVIVRKIEASGVSFDVDVPTMLELKRAGATEGLLLALLERRGKGEKPPAAIPGASARPSDMALIPAGPFRMGADGREDFSPAREVWVDAFAIDRYEVTNEEYERFDPRHRREAVSGCDRCPVTNVSWQEANAYAKSVGKRLPTEAEWEKAARGPESALFGYGAEFDKALAVVMTSSASPVGSHPPNGYGLYDVLGNVWEWCADYYGSDTYVRAANRNPTGPESGTGRVVRGGSFHNGSEVHLAVRTWSNPHYRYRSIGFRCARDVPRRGAATP